MTTRDKIYLIIGSFCVGSGMMALIFTGEARTIIGIMLGILIVATHFTPNQKDEWYGSVYNKRRTR